MRKVICAKKNGAGARTARRTEVILPFNWAVGEFDTSTGPVKGASATAEVLLPIAAVAVGMTVPVRGLS